jgi:hypothetical protein
LLQEDFWQVNKPMHAKQKECLFFQWRLMTNTWKALKGMVWDGWYKRWRMRMVHVTKGIFPHC